MQSPSIGRIVHYSSGGKCLAAAITEIAEDGEVTLLVFHPDGKLEVVTIGQDEREKLDQSWHWPERVGWERV